jgi:redox-sensing transcriptional repressor
MIGLFYIDPSKKGKEVSGINIQMVDELEEFMKTHQVDIVALTIPKESAEPIARRLIELGVKAFWNFAHVDLDVPEGVIVENVHLSDSLMTLSYNITKLK